MNFRKELSDILLKDNAEPVTDFDLTTYSENILLKNFKQLPVLYRFSPADYYNIRALETQTLYLSEARNLNDIFEGLSCTIDDYVLDNISTLKDLAYTKSFTETKDDLKMWSIYADNFAGMCVAYDFKDVTDSEWIWHLFPVCYSNCRKTSETLKDAPYALAQLKRDIEDHNYFDKYCYAIQDILPLFLVKSHEWESEKEWRIVVSYLQLHSTPQDVDDKGNESLYEIDNREIYVPFATDIYLGPRMEQQKKDHLRSIAKALGIRCHEMVMHPSEYRLIEK